MEVDAEEGAVVIRPAIRPRAGWDAAFRATARRGGDRLADAVGHALSRWDEEGWEWE